MDISALALAGLDHAQTKLENTAGRLAHLAAPASNEIPADTVDLSTSMVDMLAAKDEFAVNIKVLKVANEMNGQVLDLLA